MEDSAGRAGSISTDCARFSTLQLFFCNSSDRSAA